VFGNMKPEKTVNTKVREINQELDRLEAQADAAMVHLCDRILELATIRELGLRIKGE
jgi:hypothetical protein